MNLNKNYTASIAISKTNEETTEHKNQPLHILIKIAKRSGQKIIILNDKEGEISRFNNHTNRFEKERVNNKKLNKKRKISRHRLDKAS